MTPSPAIRRRRAARRAEILSAAWALARDNGIASVSLRELADAVGLRAPSLYEYFSDKDAIYDAMFAQGWDALREKVQALPEIGDRAVDLTRGTQALLDFSADDLVRYQLMYTRVIPGWEPSPEAYAASVRAYEVFTERMARVGITDPVQIDTWTALSAGLAAQQAANEPGGHRYRKLLPDIVQMFLAHIDTKERT